MASSDKAPCILLRFEHLDIRNPQSSGYALPFFELAKFRRLFDAIVFQIVSICNKFYVNIINYLPKHKYTS